MNFGALNELEMNQLKYFLACARLGSLTKAAEELYTTQPHVSMVIKSLEKNLGVGLFRRKSRGVELTEEGMEIVVYAENVLKNAELICSVCREKKHTSLRIATNPTSHLAVLLTEYYRQQNKEEFFMRYTECGIEELLSLISKKEYDLGFLFVPEHKKPALFHMLGRLHMEFVPLLATDLVLYVGKEHPLYGASSIAPRHLADLRFIQMEDDFFAIEDLLSCIPQFHKKNLVLNRIVRTNSNHMMIQMLQNTELCNLGSFWLRDMYRQHDFGRITVEGFQGKVSFGYVKCCGHTVSGQEGAFLEFLGRALEQDSGQKR